MKKKKLKQKQKPSRPVGQKKRSGWQSVKVVRGTGRNETTGKWFNNNVQSLLANLPSKHESFTHYLHCTACDTRDDRNITTLTQQEKRKVCIYSQTIHAEITISDVVEFTQSAICKYSSLPSSTSVLHKCVG